MTKKQANKLEIGDKVICNKSFKGLPKKEWIGKVIKKRTNEGSPLSIQWGKTFSEGHDCGGIGLFGHCRNYDATSFETQNLSIIDIYSKQLEFEF